MSHATHEDEGYRVAAVIEPADAFALLGNVHRLGILEVLSRSDRPLTFSELYGAMELDDSAHFNYHLDKLTDHFVSRDEEGYRLREAGKKVVRSILAGSINTEGRLVIETTDPCVACGSDIEARYRQSRLSMVCPSCGHGHGEYTFPPGGFANRSDDEVLSAFDQRVKHLHCLAKDGVCHECNGKMETTITREDGDCCLGTSLRAEHACNQCGYNVCSAIGLGLVDQSTVVAFHESRGIDLSNTPYWCLDWCVSDDPISVVSQDPWQIEITMNVNGDRLIVLVDGSLAVRESRTVHD